MPARVVETIDTLEPELMGLELPLLGRRRGARRRARARRPLPRARGQPAHPERHGLRRGGARGQRAAAGSGRASASARRAAVAAGGALEAVSPVDSPRMAVLTDGPDNAAYWEHERLARDARRPARDARRARPVGRRRRLPPHQRRPARARHRPEAGAGLPRAPDRDGERVRDRGRRRQARARLRRGHGPLLPRRGAAGAVGAHLRPRPSRGARGGARPLRGAGDQAARGLRRRSAW